VVFDFGSFAAESNPECFSMLYKLFERIEI